MGALGQAMRLVLADQVVDTPVEIELLDSGVLKAIRVVRDRDIEHHVVTYYGAGEWKSFDLKTYSLIIDNLDYRTVECFPGLSSNSSIRSVVFDYLNSKPFDLGDTAAANCADDLIRHLEASVRYHGYPALSLKLVATSDRMQAQALTAAAYST